MRLRRRLWRAVAVVGLAAACGLTVVCLNYGSTCRLRLHQLEAVSPGMTRAEVEAVLGGPPGDYRTDRERFSVAHHSIQALGFEEWVGDEAKVEVWFNADGRVVRRRVCTAIDQRPRPLKRLAGWLQD